MRRKRRIDWRMCALLLCLSASPVAIGLAQPAPFVQADSSRIELRTFDSEKLEEIKSSRDYRYDREPEKRAMSFLERLLNYILETIFRMIFSAESSTGVRYFIYALCGLIIVYGVLKLSGADVSKIFFRKGQGGGVSASGFTEDDLHGRDFPEEIAKAVKDRLFREAVRLQYLFVLKMMADKGMIAWKIDKTNREYGMELKDGSLKKPFSKVTYIFENAYYGHFPVGEAAYTRIESDFSAFRKQIS